MKGRLVLLATMFVVIALNACGDVTSIKASLPITVDTLSAFALSGTPPSYPSGVAILARQVVRVDGFASFDVALDIDASGNAIIYPVKLVVASGGSRPVGLLKLPGAFDQIMEAPKTGFESDSALVMLPGEVVVVESAHSGDGDLCRFALSPNIYAKIAVDSVNLASRTLYFRLGLDPNCGFRSFATGIPTS
ncbi:MAG TPA: hypothetical protein VEK37_02520 [Gemmatimonadaceae bacterium]|nr:hypothetical protein [Gemmatimonadaceae bacterium]